MFGIGETEFIIILIFGFLLFGPDKLPGMGRTIGRVLRQFREASEGFTEVVQTNVIDPATQELNNTGSNKRTPAAAQAKTAQVDDEDADIEEGTEPTSDESAPKRETFAERKARLQAERAAREAAAAEQDQAAASGAGDDSDADAPVAQSEAPSSDTSGNQAKPAATAEGKASPSVAELYSRGSRRSSRAQAEDAKANGNGDPEGQTVSEGAPAAADDPDVDATHTEGEEGEAHA